ncbi:MAG: hypothetical protein KF764_31485 [Labilithrix sp.]|nr:hypothetical protein [Labilithrix sp.]
MSGDPQTTQRPISYLSLRFAVCRLVTPGMQTLMWAVLHFSQCCLVTSGRLREPQRTQRPRRLLD